VQSGSDVILKAMNRRHDADFYLRLVERIRRARPDIALSSDFIVGFPGESDADFEATLRLVREVGFASAFSFKFSPRPGTPAAAMADQIPEEVKAERLGVLQALLNAQQDQFNTRCIGAVMPVLFEKPGRHPGQIIGRSPYLQPVFVSGPASLIGQIVTASITGKGSYSLQGELSPGRQIPPFSKKGDGMMFNSAGGN
jgi:tRNA-2-methylthio-N6-dimethylallyladenosine synthase